MEAVGSSEMLVKICQTTRLHVPEFRYLDMTPITQCYHSFGTATYKWLKKVKLSL
jgi:hypothetical protein